MSAIAVLPPTAAPSRLALAKEALIARGGLVLLAVALLVFLTVPLAMILVRSLEVLTKQAGRRPDYNKDG